MLAWTRTVPSLISSALAISLFELPFAIRASISVSRGLNGVLGPYGNPLPAAGIIQLLNNGTLPAVYLEVPYLSLTPWSMAADGTGHSLVLKRPSYGEGFVQA